MLTENPYEIVRRNKKIRDAESLEKTLYAVCVYLNQDKPEWLVSMLHCIDDGELLNCGYLRGPNQFSLYIGVDWKNAERLRISISWPRDAKGNTVLPYHSEKVGTLEITVSRFKEPRLIANDIKKRLLPDAIPAFNKVLNRLNANTDYANGAKAMKDRMAKALGMGMGMGSGEGYTGNTLFCYKKIGCAKSASIDCYPNRVDLTIDGISPELAERIIQLVKQA